jgi:3-mercaptopyruvate sulfurtransferase SseA
LATDNDASSECGDESIVVRVFVNANEDPKVPLLDARSAGAFGVSRIPGAKSLPWTQLVESTRIDGMKRLADPEW